MTPELDHFDVGDRRIALRKRVGRSPTLLFLPGFASDMEGAKAVALDAFAGRRGLACLRFDYSGTGSSGGDFADGTLARWLDEALAVVDRLSEGPLIAIRIAIMLAWLGLAPDAALPNPATAAIPPMAMNNAIGRK